MDIAGKARRLGGGRRGLDGREGGRRAESCQDRGDGRDDACGGETFAKLGVSATSRIRGTTEAKVARVPAGEGRQRPEGVAAGTFSGQLRSARLQQGRARLDELLADIDRRGADLAEDMTLVNLKGYREAVRRFLAELQRQAVSVQTEVDWDYQAWEHRSLTVIRQVDQELESLSRQVMEQEKDRLAILARIGDIKGLLLDIKI